MSSLAIKFLWHFSCKICWSTLLHPWSRKAKNFFFFLVVHIELNVNGDVWIFDTELIDINKTRPEPRSKVFPLLFKSDLYIIVILLFFLCSFLFFLNALIRGYCIFNVSSLSMYVPYIRYLMNICIEYLTSLKLQKKEKIMLEFSRLFQYFHYLINEIYFINNFVLFPLF